MNRGATRTRTSLNTPLYCLLARMLSDPIEEQHARPPAVKPRIADEEASQHDRLGRVMLIRRCSSKSEVS